MYLRVFEVVIVLIVIYVVLSQIALPALRGTALFPWFREERKLRDTMVDVNQVAREQRMARDLAAGASIEEAATSAPIADEPAANPTPKE